MPEAVLRAGILGCGRIAGAAAERAGRPVTHAQALTAHGAFRLVAVADPDPARARSFAGRWSCEAVDDLGELGLDLAVICTPDSSHAHWLGHLLRSPRPPPRLVVVEKPLCTDAGQAAELVELARAHPATAVVVNHTRRFDPGHRAVRDLVRDGAYGPVLGVRWTHYGGWLHNGVHLVDALRMILDGELEPLHVERGCQDRDGDPCLDGVFRSAAHPQARILVESFPETAFQLFEGEIRLADARIRLVDFGDEIWLDRVEVNQAGERELKTGYRLCPDDGRTPMMVLHDLAARFLLTGDTDIVSRSGLDQALATMSILFQTASRLSP